MSVAISLLRKSEATKSALKRLFTLMHPEVVLHVAKFFERRVADVAHQGLVETSCLIVGLVNTTEFIILGVFRFHFL
jgi:hypothetical protein